MPSPCAECIDLRAAAPGRWIALGLWALLLTPPARSLLESSMVLQLMVQYPALVLLGAMVVWTTPRRRGLGRGVDALLRGGAAGLAVAAILLMLWMLPRLVDAAVLDFRVALLKFVSLSASGAALALSWPRCPPLARVVVHVEVIATLARFGWGFAEAPQRLCAVYLFDDQLRTGIALLIVAAAYAVIAAWAPLFGSPRWPAHLPRNNAQVRRHAQPVRTPALDGSGAASRRNTVRSVVGGTTGT